jgi:hypothetical protein
MAFASPIPDSDGTPGTVLFVPATAWIKKGPSPAFQSTTNPILTKKLAISLHKAGSRIIADPGSRRILRNLFS